jgi:RNA polymerase sigma-70 factor, ECF subfamily
VTGDHGEEAGMGAHDSFAEVERKLREGDQDAATEIFCRFAKGLIGLAHTKLDIRVLPKEGPDDVVQSVFRTFFIRHRDGEYDLATWDKLWSMLTVITVRKCLNRNEYYLAKRRDVRREVPAADWKDAAAGLSEFIDRKPTSLEAAVLIENVKHMMHGLEPDERAMIALRLQGYKNREISAQVGCSERTVTRVHAHIEDRLRRMHADEIHVA